MRGSEKDRVYGAVKACLNRCYAAGDPLVQATTFVDQLRQEPGWDPKAVSQVESLVLRSVRVIVRQTTNDCCHQRA